MSLTKKPQSNLKNEVVDITHPKIHIISNVLIKSPNQSNDKIATPKNEKNYQPPKFTSKRVQCTNCRKPAHLNRVSKNVPSKGKLFYNCTDCNFIEWADSFRDESSASQTKVPSESNVSDHSIRPFSKNVKDLQSHHSRKHSFEAQPAVVKFSQTIDSSSTAITVADDDANTACATKTKKANANRESHHIRARPAKNVVISKGKNRMTKSERKKRNSLKKRDTIKKITKRNVKGNKFVPETDSDDCNSASSLSEIEFEMPIRVRTQFSTKVSVGTSETVSRDTSLHTSTLHSSGPSFLFNAHSAHDKQKTIDSNRVRESRNEDIFEQSVEPTIDSVTESENESWRLFATGKNEIESSRLAAQARSHRNRECGISDGHGSRDIHIESITESENESSQLHPPVDCLREHDYSSSQMNIYDSDTESENESSQLFPPIVNRNGIHNSSNSRNTNVNNSVESESESVRLVVTESESENVQLLVTESESENVQLLVTESESENVKLLVTESESENLQLLVTESENENLRCIPQISKRNRQIDIIAEGDGGYELSEMNIGDYVTILNDDENNNNEEPSSLNGIDDISWEGVRQRPSTQTLETDEILWELRVINKQNETTTVQNKKIMGNLKKMREGFEKLTKKGDFTEIKRVLPNKTRERFVAWDERLTTDREFYKDTYLYLRRYRGNPKNTNYYGSVLKRIMSDDVINEYNFGGTKGKYKLENFVLVDLLYGMTILISI